jgi:SAM-dependent methyltransferase
MNETSKSVIRRFYDIRYCNTYFVGKGIDIGCGADSIGKYSEQFPLMTELRPWDWADGDAEQMASLANGTYDFVHSSHCLEHVKDPYTAFKNWLRILKPNGYMIVTVPDEDMYEQGNWPSHYNPDHKTTWTILKAESWSPVSINLWDFLARFKNDIEVIKIEKLTTAYIRSMDQIDQTYYNIAECSIEFILRKL